MLNDLNDFLNIRRHHMIILRGFKDIGSDKAVGVKAVQKISRDEFLLFIKIRTDLFKHIGSEVFTLSGIVIRLVAIWLGSGGTASVAVFITRGNEDDVLGFMI